MRERITVNVSNVDGAVWAYVTSLGDFPDIPLHQVLLWILEQLNFGNFRIDTDSRGANASLILGLDAAPSSTDTTLDAETGRSQQRLISLDIATVLASAREQGIRPEEKDLADSVQASLTEYGYLNMELVYAFELVHILKRIREKTFVFSSPPIMGKATADGVRLLGEATRAYLLGLTRGSVSLCRACIEVLLKDRLEDRREDILREMQSPKRRGELEALIRVAQTTRVLSDEMAGWAHTIRKCGNDAAHSGKAPTDDQAWEVLVQTRGIAEFIHR